MVFDSVVVGPVGTNCYLLGDETAGVCALVDPGDEPEKLLSMVEKNGLTLEKIFLTHGHYDHREAVAPLLERFPGLTVYINEKEVTKNIAETRYFYYGGPFTPYGEGDTVTVGNLTFKVLLTPGHTAGSVVLVGEGVMMAGDTLFAGTCGRCDLPGGSLDDMMKSLKRLSELPGDYRVYPGHGHATTLEQERQGNHYMRQAVNG